MADAQPAQWMRDWLQSWYSYNHNCHNRFTALFLGSPGWASARRKLLDFMVQGKINRGRHTDHLAGRHSIRTNQCPPPSSPHFFTGRMPFLPPDQQCQSTEGNISYIYFICCFIYFELPSVLWCCWLGGRKGIRPVKVWGDGGGGHWLVRVEWHPAGWSVCLPLLVFPCSIKSRSSLLALAHPGGPGKRAINGCGSSYILSEA